MSQGVVSYRNSTSNHNWKSSIVFSSLLYLIEILHQTTTCQEQHKEQQALYLIEILHQTTTRPSTFRLTQTLYLIEILHQTTTAPRTIFICRRLYLIEILHQTTTPALFKVLSSGCILSKFYIKPQLFLRRELCH